MNQFKEMLIID